MEEEQNIDLLDQIISLLREHGYEVIPPGAKEPVDNPDETLPDSADDYDWTQVPTGFDWVATDGVGNELEVYAYVHEPGWDRDVVAWCAGSTASIHGPLLDLKPITPPERSLRQRPGTKWEEGR
jgi:hypothetical protein